MVKHWARLSLSFTIIAVSTRIKLTPQDLRLEASISFLNSFRWKSNILDNDYNLILIIIYG